MRVEFKYFYSLENFTSKTIPFQGKWSKISLIMEYKKNIKITRST